MKLPNGYGSVVKLSGKRRKPYMVRKTVGYHIDPIKEKKVAEYIIIGYTATKSEGLQLLADYNHNPYDTKAAKMTFSEVYEEWSRKKYPTVSESNVKGYSASYKACTILYHRIFKDLKLADLQQVIDTCGKNYPTLKKIKILFNQLYGFALKNDICNKDYSSFVDIAQYKDRNPNKHSRNKFSKEEVEKIWTMKDDKYYQIPLMLLYNGTRISEFLSLNFHPVFCRFTTFQGAKEKPQKRDVSEVYLHFHILYDYLLLNCGARRAALRPYFLRSFIRGSRVRNPAALRTGLYSLSASRRALEIPCLIAPACPVYPPPCTFTSTSNLPSVSVAASG